MINDRIIGETSGEQVALFRSRVAVLFERMPMLCGFYVTHDLNIVEVAVHCWPGCTPPGDIGSVLCAALEDLMEDRAEEVAEFLRGQTFARALH